MKQRTWDLQVLTNWEDIWSNDFVAKWLDLMDRSPTAHVFFHPAIVRVWVDTYRPLRTLQPLFVHARNGDQEVIFPLVFWRQNWKNGFVRTIVPAGYSDFDYHDPIFLRVPEPNENTSFFEALKRCLNSHIGFDRILIDGLHAQFVPDLGKVVRSEGCISWSLRDLEQYRGVVLPPKRHLANEVKRRMRRLEELAPLQFRRFGRHHEPDLISSLEMMLECHKQRWPMAYRPPKFHMKLIQDGLRSGIVDFFDISQNGKPIAWRICLRYKGRLSCYLTAYDENFSKYAVGYLSVGFALQCAMEDGINEADELRGQEDYKRSWEGQTTLVHDIVYDRAHYSGRFRIAMSGLLRSLKGFVSLR